jgi:hypothetical protein
MTLLTSKWMMVIYVLVFILLVLYLSGCKSVHSQVKIEAPPEAVWKVLTDFENIKEWNNVLIPIEGELKEGAIIKYEFHQDANTISVIPATVKQMIKNKLLNQTGGMTGILTFDHKYILEEVKDSTNVIIHEDYRGVMVPFWNPAPVEEAYNRLGKALKERVNQLKEN